MGELIFIIVMSVFLIAGYVMMGKVDQFIDESSYQVLVIYDQLFQQLVKFQCQDIIFVEKSMIQDFAEHMTYVVIATHDDYYNLMMNYHLKKYHYEGSIYAYCHDRNYLHLYQKENIHILDDQKEVEDMLEKMYENHI